MRKLQHYSGFVSLLCILLALSSCGMTASSQTTQYSTPATISTVFTQKDSTNFKGFTFEKSIACWDTSEGAFKQATFTSSTFAHSGYRSLEIKTVLKGDKAPNFLPVDSHTETKFSSYNCTPNGYSKQGPYNWKGKTVSVWAFFPNKLAGSTVDLYTADTGWVNERSFTKLTTSNTQKWIQLSMIVGSGVEDNNTPAYDPTDILALGVRVVTPPKSRIDFLGSFFIDDVQLP